MTVSFALTVSSAVINVLPSTVANDATVRAVTAGFAAFTAFTMVASEGTLIAYMKQMKNKYKKEIRDLQQRVDRSYLYYEKARNDGVITTEELTTFYQILKSNLDLKVSH